MFSTKESQISFVLELASKFMETINTPKSLGVFILIKYRMFDELANFGITVDDYMDSNSFMLDYQAVSFLKKWELLPTTYDKSAVAMSSFIEAERQCFITNKVRIPHILSGRSPHLFERFCSISRRISHVLGTCPRLDELVCRFGPGASSSCGGKFNTLVHKLSVTSPAATPRLKQLIEETGFSVWANNWSLYRACVAEIVDGEVSTVPDIHPLAYNKLCFVPKNGKTDRAICIEPDLNIYFQLGAGEYIRNRMRLKLGLDLDNLADRNKCLARIGSREDSLSTIDLRAASDTISMKLVEWLLPEDWYKLLCTLRSPKTIYPDGTVHLNEKFSSMGNGFTFELESLIFTCILREANRLYVGDDYIAQSFGDDCIINREGSAEAINLMESLGFAVNEEKSFTSGLFRESCGGDFFNGHPVRPYFLKRSILDVRDLFTIANRIRKSSCVSLNEYFADKRYRPVWCLIERRVPRGARVYGPPCSGENECFHVGKSEAPNTSTCKDGILRVKVLQSEASAVNLRKFTPSAQIGTFLYVGSKPSYRGATRCRYVYRQFPFWELTYLAWI